MRVLIAAIRTVVLYVIVKDLLEKVAIQSWLHRGALTLKRDVERLLSA